MTDTQTASTHDTSRLPYAPLTMTEIIRRSEQADAALGRWTRYCLVDEKSGENRDLDDYALTQSRRLARIAHEADRAFWARYDAERAAA